jgi:hypothetical protein
MTNSGTCGFRCLRLRVSELKDSRYQLSDFRWEQVQQFNCFQFSSRQKDWTSSGKVGWSSELCTSVLNSSSTSSTGTVEIKSPLMVFQAGVYTDPCRRHGECLETRYVHHPFGRHHNARVESGRH